MLLIAGQKSIVISIAEPVGIVKQTFREYGLRKASTNKNIKTIDKFIDYNSSQFMDALLQDIFDGSTEIGDYIPSTRILVKDGMDEKTAIRLAEAAFYALKGSIDVVVPNVDYCVDGYRFNICDEYDMHVAPSYLDE